MQSPGTSSSDSTRLCCICNKPVFLEKSRKDEHGNAVHFECQATGLKLGEAGSLVQEKTGIVTADYFDNDDALRTTRYGRWLSFHGTIGEWIAEQAKFGRRFVAAERLVFDNGSYRVKFRCAHHPNDPSEVVAIQDNYLSTTTHYHPAFKLPE